VYYVQALVNAAQHLIDNNKIAEQQQKAAQFC
jgi:hypothetical protein